jgi:nucleotide-binding universal stress UspA family protein
MENIDLIVIGGRTNFEKLLLGSVPSNIMKCSPSNKIN